MARSFSGLVVLLPDLEPIVGDWRARYDTSVYGLPAHVTVLAPWIPPEQLTEADLDTLAQLLKSWQPFEVSFGAFGQFETGAEFDVHYLAPEPADHFLGLVDDLCAVWPEYEPYEGMFDDVIPHLTVATTAKPEQAARFREQIEPRLPIATIATELSLVAIRDDDYSLVRNFRLGGKKKKKKS